MTSLRQKMVDQANADVNKITLSDIGFSSYVPWCGYYISYLALKVGNNNDINIKGEVIGGYPAVETYRGDAGYIDFYSNGKYFDDKKIDIGDLVVFDWVSHTTAPGPKLDHVGIIVDIDRLNKTITYVDGNSEGKDCGVDGKVKKYTKSYDGRQINPTNSNYVSKDDIAGFVRIDYESHDGESKEFNPNTGVYQSLVVVSSGQIANGLSIGNNYYQEVQSGGVASSCVITSGGTQKINTGGHVVSSVISSGGYLNLTDNSFIAGISASRTAQATGVRILSGGLMNTRGGVDWSTEVNDGGQLIIFNKGLSISANVLNGGLQKVNNNASAYYALINSGGRQDIASGGYAFSTKLSGAQYVYSGGLTSATQVKNGGSLMVNSGASAIGGTVSSGGSYSVFSGAYTSGITIYNGGKFGGFTGATVYGGVNYNNGASANFSIVNGVASNVFLNGMNLTVQSGHTAYNTIVTGGALLVSGGYENGATLKGSGWETLRHGGRSYNAVVSSGASQIVLSSSLAQSARISGGSQIISSGGSALNTKIYYGGVQKAQGVASSVDLYSASYQYVESGGLANNIYVGSNSRQIVSSGGSATNVSAGHNGGVLVSRGGVAKNLTVSLGGFLNVYSGGLVSGVIVSAGGSQTVQSGGSAYNVTVSSGGAQYVSSGGYVSGGQVYAGGSHIAATGARVVNFIVGGSTYQADNYEANDSLASASVMASSGSVSGLTIHNSSDVDYFKFNLTDKGTANNFVKINLTSGSGDLDMRLFDSGGNLIQSSTTTSSVENLSLNGLNAGVYYAQVYGYNGASGGYSMNWNVKGSSPLPAPTPVVNPTPAPVVTPDGLQRDRYEANDTLAQAAVMASSGTVSGLTVHNSSDVDYFKFNLTGKGTANNFVKINLTSGSGDLDMRLFDSGGNLIQSSTTTSSVENLSLNGLNAGVYYAQVYGYNGASGGYSMNWNVKGSSPLPAPTPVVNPTPAPVVTPDVLQRDRYEANDTLAQAAVMASSGTVSGLTVHNSSDVDYFKFNLTGKGTANNFIKINLTSGSGDLDMRLFDSAGNLVQSSTTTSSVENITLNGLNAGVYYAKVYGYNGASGDYSMSWNVKGSAPTPAISFPSAGVQIVGAGARTSRVTLLAGGSQRVISGGYAYLTQISGGVQTVSRGGLASNTRISGGSQAITSGGSASYTFIYKGGTQRVYNKGKVVSSYISGGKQVVSKGGSAINTHVKSGGKQYVYGVASRTIVSRGGQQIAYKGAIVTSDAVYGSALQTVYGVAKYDTIYAGGVQVVASGGNAIDARVRGSSVIKKGGVAQNPIISGVVTTLAGAKVNFTKASVISGTLNISGGSVTGSNSASLTLARNGVINMTANGRINAPIVNIGSGTLNITGAGNAVRKIGSVAKSRTMFNIGAVNVKSVTPMLKTTANVNLVGSMTIQSVKNQNIGVYELTSNITRYAPVYLKINNTYKTFSINPGSSLTASGMTYKLVKSGKSLNLSVTIKQGKAIKGTSRSESLNGTANSDIFYGGKGNDVIRGNGGRDVAVYDRNNWGQDVIANTKGTMTILFNGVKSSEVSKTRVGNDLIINRKSNPSQQITVRNWNTDTHNIVFGGIMGQLSKYTATSRPTTAQTANASREVWKKTGLLA